jgi:hypothetical protein
MCRYRTCNAGVNDLIQHSYDIGITIEKDSSPLPGPNRVRPGYARSLELLWWR